MKEDVLEVSEVRYCLRASVGFLRKRVKEKCSSEPVRTRGERPAERTLWLKRNAWGSRHGFVKEVAF